MKIVTIVGARPQFIKAAPVSKALRLTGNTEILIHTGQHFDGNMSDVFFNEMKIPEPNYNLGIGSGSHAWQTGQMMIKLEELLQKEKPDWVLLYGDTNSTLAGALAACKLNLPVAHVEAGLRSFNRKMPEEHNRVLTDHCAEVLFCPTQTAVDNLKHEGIVKKVFLVGDTMHDALRQFSAIALQKSTILQELDLSPKSYLLATVHRPYNTDVSSNLNSILSAFKMLDDQVVFPVHPRTRQKIEQLDQAELWTGTQNIKFIEPVGYLDMLMLEQHARMILTDSGGIQKEAYLFGVPCITLRPETEWLETVNAGWNVIVGADAERIIEAVQSNKWPSSMPPPVFGDGKSAGRIVEHLACL